jgi:hypothetical protein
MFGIIRKAEEAERDPSQGSGSRARSFARLRKQSEILRKAQEAERSFARLRKQGEILCRAQEAI